MVLLVEVAPMEGHAKSYADFEMVDTLQGIPGTKVDLVMSGAVRKSIIVRESEANKSLIDGS
jgi:hypothetical protein